jgi:hypothetical protein
MRGRNVLGGTTTGDGGYFRFRRPDAGSYTITVVPPQDREDLCGAERTVYHVRGRRTFVTIELQRAEPAPDTPGQGPAR